jgi:hypothetical protein
MGDATIPPLLNSTSGPRQWLRMWGLSALVWLGLWLVHNASLAGAEAAAKVSWITRLVHLGDYSVSATLALPFLFLAWRMPLDADRWRRSLVGLVGLLMAFSALDVGICLGVRALLGQWHDAFRPYRMSFVAIWALNTVVYGAVASVGWAIQYQREARFRERRASQLETRLAEARLDSLRTQLQPHFLFNALNAVSALVRSDPAGAERMIARLSDLLRCSLAEGGTQEVSLKQELEITERYVEIERVRFADRLTVVRNVAPDTLDAHVPSLVLQPLVENAIRHGIAYRSGPGQVEIASAREGDSLVLAVRDDGRGFTGESTQGAGRGAGVGLTNTRARLEQLYGSRGSLTIARRAEGGAEVTLRIPWRPVGDSPALGSASGDLAQVADLPRRRTTTGESAGTSAASLS